MLNLARCAMTLHRALVWAGRLALRGFYDCPVAVRPLTTATVTCRRMYRKRPLSLSARARCGQPHRCLSSIYPPAASTTSSDIIVVGLDSLPALPMPTRSHPRLAPFPLSRMSFGSPIRPSLHLPALLSSLSSFLAAGGNVVELPRGRHREVAESVRLWQQEQSDGAVGAGSGEVLYVVSVGWRDVVQFIEERRAEWREQQRVEEELEYRRKRRQQIKQQNLAAQQQQQQQQQQQLNGHPSTDAATTAAATLTQPSSTPTAAQTAEVEAGKRKEEEEDELLPINRLDLCHSDTPIDFATIDIFPYLHAHLTALSHVASLPQLPLVLLDDVDLVPNDVRNEYVSRWFIALEQCVLARRIRRYGVTSTHFTSSLPLQRCVQAARDILDEPHFAAIRFPLNVYDTRAMTELCCDDDTAAEKSTVVQLAKRHGLLCIADAGVDVVDVKGDEHRLVSAGDGEGEERAEGKTIAEQLKGAFNVALYMEKQLQQLMAGREDELTRIGVDRMEVSWAHVMAAQMSLIDNAVRWDRLLHDTIQPTLQRALYRLSSHVSDEPGPGGTNEWERWCRDYRQCTNVLFSTFSASVAHASESEAESVAQWLDSECVEVRRLGRLEQKVLLLALCSGVDVVCTSEVQRVVEVLEAGWKEEELRTGRQGQVDEDWPGRWLSVQRALEVLKKHEQKQS